MGSGSSLLQIHLMPPAPLPAFVFVVDVCTVEEELATLKREVLWAVVALLKNAVVRLVSFRDMLLVQDLGFADCSPVLVFHGEQELSLGQQSKNLFQLFGIFLPFTCSFGRLCV